MKNSGYILSLGLAAILAGTALPAAAQTAEQLVSFGDRFFEDGDYYLALGEYRKALVKILECDGAETEKSVSLRLKIALCYQTGEKWLESVRELGNLPESLCNCDVLYVRGYGEYMMRDPYAARKDLAKAEAVCEARGKVSALLLKGVMGIDMGDAEDARKNFEAARGAAGDEKTKAQVGLLLEGLDRFEAEGDKSLVLAGVLGVVPGLGHLYTEHYPDALQVFGLVSVFGGLTAAFAYNEYHYRKPGERDFTATYVAGSLSGLIYLSAVWSAIASAKRYNIARQLEMLEVVKKQYLEIEADRKAVIFSYTYRF